jgi:putative ABC transport system substrate-binding protein
MQTANYVAEILNGKDPGSIDVTVAKGSDLVVNKTVADKLGFKIPQSVLDRATSIK